MDFHLSDSTDILLARGPVAKNPDACRSEPSSAAFADLNMPATSTVMSPMRELVAHLELSPRGNGLPHQGSVALAGEAVPAAAFQLNVTILLQLLMLACLEKRWNRGSPGSCW